MSKIDKTVNLCYEVFANRYGWPADNSAEFISGGAVMARLKIVEGPGKYNFVLSGCEPGKNITLTLMRENGTRFKVVLYVRSFEKEDGGCEKYNISGHHIGTTLRYNAFLDLTKSQGNYGWFEYAVPNV